MLFSATLLKEEEEKLFSVLKASLSIWLVNMSIWVKRGDWMIPCMLTCIKPFLSLGGSGKLKMYIMNIASPYVLLYGWWRPDWNPRLGLRADVAGAVARAGAWAVTGAGAYVWWQPVMWLDMEGSCSCNWHVGGGLQGTCWFCWFEYWTHKPEYDDEVDNNYCLTKNLSILAKLKFYLFCIWIVVGTLALVSCQ